MCCCFGRKVSAGKSISAAAAFYEFGRGVDERRQVRVRLHPDARRRGVVADECGPAPRVGRVRRRVERLDERGGEFRERLGGDLERPPRAVSIPRRRAEKTQTPRRRANGPGGKNRAPTAKEAAFDPSDEDQYSPPREEEDPWDPPWVDAPPVEAGTHRSKTFRQTLAATKCRVAAPNADQTAAAKRGPPPGWWSFETFETFVRTPSPATEPRAAVFVFPRAAFSSHAHRSTRRTSSAARADASLRFAERAEAASYTSDAARAASDKNASVNRAASPASSRFASARSYRRVPAYTLAACAALAVCDATRNARDRASTRAAIFRTSATHRSAPTSSSKKVGTASSSRYAAAHPATASANRSAAAPVPATSAARLGAASSAARSAADAAAADARGRGGAGSAFFVQRTETPSASAARGASPPPLEPTRPWPSSARAPGRRGRKKQPAATPPRSPPPRGPPPPSLLPLPPAPRTSRRRTRCRSGPRPASGGSARAASAERARDKSRARRRDRRYTRRRPDSGAECLVARLRTHPKVRPRPGHIHTASLFFRAPPALRRGARAIVVAEARVEPQGERAVGGGGDAPKRGGRVRRANLALGATLADAPTEVGRRR